MIQLSSSCTFVILTTLMNPAQAQQCKRAIAVQFWSITKIVSIGNTDKFHVPFESKTSASKLISRDPGRGISRTTRTCTVSGAEVLPNTAAAV
jgi:hypothetical protein